MIRSLASLAPAPACRACGGANLRRVTACTEAEFFGCRDCGAASAQYAATAAATDLDPQRAAAPDHFGGVDPEKYARSVKAARQRSYAGLLERVRPYAPGGAWLDIGCSYGWLLHYLADHGYAPEGIEPSPSAAARALAGGHVVHVGLFPEAAPRDRRFQVVSLLDVLEHLESPQESLQAAREVLAPGGVLVIQVPDQNCWLYRLAEWLQCGSGGRLGFAHRRLWLVDFDFPHQTYFTERGLRMLLANSGWCVQTLWKSPLGSPREALDRVSYDRQAGLSALTNRLVAWGVAGIQVADNCCGHGGLLTVIAAPAGSAG